MLFVQPPPAGDDLLRLAELGGDRRAAMLDEERVRPPAKLEVGPSTPRHAIPSLSVNEELLDRYAEIHIDFMIGSDEVTVTGVTRAGDEIPLLAGGAWQI